MKNSQHFKTNARKRWNILIKAVKNFSLNDGVILNSLRNDHDFHVFDIQTLPRSDGDERWCSYELSYRDIQIQIQIRLSPCNFQIEDLVGFNNTGNVRIWPSEEILSYISLKHRSLFDNKSVLEIGGGMSCLAGICLAQDSNCLSIHVTDGNEISIKNVRHIIKRNTFKRDVTCDVLVWKDYSSHNFCYDVILAADCLFFDDSRNDLIRLIQALLKPNGVALIMSPERGNSLNKFLNEARNFELTCTAYYRYDNDIWEQLQKLKNTNGFVEDSSYPWFVIMQKTSALRETEWHAVMKLYETR